MRLKKTMILGILNILYEIKNKWLYVILLKLLKKKDGRSYRSFKFCSFISIKIQFIQKKTSKWGPTIHQSVE